MKPSAALLGGLWRRHNFLGEVNPLRFLLYRLVSSTAASPKVDPSAVLRSLESHPLFPKAQVCVLHKFPDLKSKAGVGFIHICGFLTTSLLLRDQSTLLCPTLLPLG